MFFKQLWITILSTFLIISCTAKIETISPINILKRHQENSDLVVRFAKLEIDSTRMDEYLVFLKEGIENSIQTEPGVLTMYAMQEEGNPSKITVLEIYASDSAYQLHLKTPHFQKYKTGTFEMVKSLELVDLKPIAFGVRNQ